MIDLSSFRMALASLGQALGAYTERPGDVFIRDATIQRFEYTYELTHKILRRYLEATEPSAEVVGEMSFQNLIRLGYERGLLRSEWSVWRTFRDNRNATSHAYDEAKAQKVFEGIPAFHAEAAALLAELGRRQEAG